MNRATFILLLICFCVPPLPTQPQEHQKAPANCEFKEILNPRGWKIPGLSRTETKVAGARYTTEGAPAGVYVDLLRPVSPADSVVLVSRESSERLEIRDQPADIPSISRFSMNGHTFGYLVTADLVTITRKGERVGLGTEERLYYYDPDGSGKFKVMRYASAELIFKIVVPKWVKQKRD